MILAIDASRAADPQKTGVGWYCSHLLRHLQPVIPSDVRVVLYSDRALPQELRPWPNNWEERVLPWPPPALRAEISNLKSQISNYPRWPLWSQVRLAERVLRDRPNVLFVPAHVIPELLTLAPHRLRPRIITTIHDVVFKEFPETYSARERWYADHATRLAVRHADRIIVPTQHVAEELRRWYGVNPAKVGVVHHGVEHSAPEAHSPQARNAIRTIPIHSEHSDVIRSIRMFPGRYILYVGRLEHKKNVVRMVEAFNAIASQFPDVQLVLAGSDGYGAEQVHTTIAQSPYRDRIHTPGWVDADAYRALLARAAVFCFPTLAEGFGLPILEAMAAGVPVITSRGGAHEEVAGDAAVLVDSHSMRAIADAMGRLLRDAKEHDRLVAAGQHRAARFTWKRTAYETWGILQSVVSI